MPLIKKIYSYLVRLLNPRSFFTEEMRTLIVVSSVGLIQGLIFSCDIVYSYIYRDDYHLSPAESSFFDASNQVPWMIKPIWGALSDNFMLWGYKRKSYLLLMALLDWLCILNFGTWLPPLTLGFVILFTTNVALSFKNCMAEAILVQNAQEISRKSHISDEEKTKAASKGVSLFFGTKYLGKILGALLIMAFFDESNRQLYLLGVSMAPLAVFFISLILPEEKSIKSGKRLMHKKFGSGETEVDSDLRSNSQAENNDSNSANDYNTSNVKKAIAFVKKPIIFKPILLMFLSTFIPQSPQAKFYYYTLYLNFESTFMGSLKLLSYVAIFLAIVIYNRYLRNVKFRAFYATTSLIGGLLTLSQLILVFRINNLLGIHDKVFAALDTFILELVLEFNALPVMILACRICPKDIEATIFAVLMAVCNAGYLTSLQLGAFLTHLLGISSDNFDNLWIMIVISSVFYLVPLTMLWRVQFEDAIQQDKDTGIEIQKFKGIPEKLDEMTGAEEENLEESQIQSIKHKLFYGLANDERLHAFS